MTRDYDFIAHVTRFCRILRAHGLLVGPAEAASAVTAIAGVDMMDYGRVYWTLRCVLVSRHQEIAVFDQLFERLWNFEPQLSRPYAKPDSGPFGGLRELRRRPATALMPEGNDAAENTLVQVVRSGASAAETSRDTDLTVLRPDDLHELSRIASRVVRALASRPGRRRKRHRRKGTPDLRGVLRENLGTGGEPVRIPRLRRVPRVPRMLVLLDVSGSMDRHAKLLLQLVYAVSQQTKRVETFVFSTALTRVTRELAAPSFSEALGRISSRVRHWSGGTRIGASVARVNDEFRELQGRHTTVFLLSDGFDTGEPQDLAREMRRMQRRVRAVVWLNPLLGTPGYEPRSRGIRAVSPYVDCFVSAMDVGHLKRLPVLLRA